MRPILIYMFLFDIRCLVAFRVLEFDILRPHRGGRTRFVVYKLSSILCTVHSMTYSVS